MILRTLHCTTEEWRSHCEAFGKHNLGLWEGETRMVRPSSLNSPTESILDTYYNRSTAYACHCIHSSLNIFNVRFHIHAYVEGRPSQKGCKNPYIIFLKVIKIRTFPHTHTFPTNSSQMLSVCFRFFKVFSTLKVLWMFLHFPIVYRQNTVTLEQLWGHNWP